MKRNWIGLALLSGAWAFGSGFFHGPGWLTFAMLVFAGWLALIGRPRAASPRQAAVAAVLLIPAVWFLPWPFKTAPALLMIGMVLRAVPVPRVWPSRLGTAATDAGVVMLVQGLGLLAYKGLTAHAHELPAVLARPLAGLATLAGFDASYNGGEIALFTMRKTHALAATWELLLDPVSIAFIVGCVIYLAIRNRWGRPLGAFLGIMLLWLPLRAVLMMAIFIHRALLTDYDAQLILMNQFWSGWVLTALLVPPVLAAAGLVSLLPPERQWGDGPPILAVRGRFALVMVALSVALVTVGALLNPAGERKQGRVFVDEHHSAWEPTERPFDTEWYGHDAGYNYACIYDYCSRFYEMSRMTNAIGPRTLEACDVLVLKVPNERAYADSEVRAIESFVDSGGGLLLIGEHTDVFMTSTHLNQVARRFGFEFRNDCLFGIDSSFDQLYTPPVIPHPVVQWMPPMDFAVSCSIAPRGKGRTVIGSTGLWHLPADYHASNFYPQVEDRADCRYGAFVQLWSTRRGKGRVLAFADSTIFSNFSAFEPGKAELMLGMIEWANRRPVLVDLRPWLVGAGIVAALMAAFLLIHADAMVGLIAAVGLLGFVVAGVGVNRYHRAAMPVPDAKRPLTTVAIDRTHCDALLSKSGFIKATPEGFGIFEQWVLKLGYFLSRRSGDDLFDSELIVFMHPHKSVTSEFVRRLEEYVREGGHVLVLDSGLNQKSTACSLLQPFGLSLDRYAEQLDGALNLPEGWPVVGVAEALPVEGGTPFAKIGDKTVGSVARHGKGSAVYVGFGSRFGDDNMGISTDIEPTPEMRQVFEVEFRLLRAIIERTLPEAEK